MRLRKYRKYYGWTQAELASRFSVSAETISAWERGKRKPDIQLIPKIAEELRMDRSELVEYISSSNTRSKRNTNRETVFDKPKWDDLLVVFQNQESCEAQIREASYHARKIKILTIRGDNYFIGKRSLLYELVVKGSTIDVLVLSPKAQHITEELAENLGHKSAEEIRGKMARTLDYLKNLAGEHENFRVKCYNEEPNFKILLFDDVMFVSSFAGQGPKNDRNTRMFRMVREENPLFAGLEKLFDELSKRSAPPP